MIYRWLVAVLLTVLPVWAAGPDPTSPQTESPVQDCTNHGAVELSPAEMKAHLRQTQVVLPHFADSSFAWLYGPIPTPGAAMRFRIEADERGNVVCVRWLSGYPPMAKAVVQSLRSWEFRPVVVRGRAQSFYGILVLVISGTKDAVKATVLTTAPEESASLEA